VLIQAVDTYLPTGYLPISMPADSHILISAAAAQTGISGRTIRAWCQQWPGLGHREGRDWRVDLDLLREIATSQLCRAGPRKLLPKPRPDLPPPPVRHSSPGPGEYLSVAEASNFLGVNSSTTVRWCGLIPGFGIRLLTERGEWLIDPLSALIVGVVRHRNNGQHPPGALVRQGKRHDGRHAALVIRRGAYLRAILAVLHGSSRDECLQFIANRQQMGGCKVPDCILQAAQVLKTKRRKRTSPTASEQLGEVRDETE
jgi:hypothetical protein